MYVIRCDKEIWIKISIIESNGDIITVPEQTLDIGVATTFNSKEEAIAIIKDIDPGYGTDEYIIEEVKNAG